MHDTRKSSRSKPQIVYADPGTKVFNQNRNVVEMFETEKARQKWQEDMRLVPQRRKKALTDICSFFSTSSIELPGKRTTRKAGDDVMMHVMEQLQRKWSSGGAPVVQSKRKRFIEPDEKPNKKRRGHELSYKQTKELSCTDAPLAWEKSWLEQGKHNQGKTTFSMPLPVDLDKIDSLYNFRLPADLFQMHETGMLDDIRSNIAAVPPSKFEKIRKSTSHSSPKTNLIRHFRGQKTKHGGRVANLCM